MAPHRPGINIPGVRCAAGAHPGAWAAAAAPEHLPAGGWCGIRDDIPTSSWYISHWYEHIYIIYIHISYIYIYVITCVIICVIIYHGVYVYLYIYLCLYLYFFLYLYVYLFNCLICFVFTYKPGAK